MKKILIIEDDNILRENTATFIREHKFEVFTAQDGLIGLQQTLRHLPDLILCDISMPNMNGFEFYETIKQIKNTAVIPLVFFSAKTEHKDIRAGMQLGADDYITKPASLYDVLKVIKTRLAKYNTLTQINNERLQALIDHPTLGIYIYQKGQLLFYNKPLANIFGYNYQEFSTVKFEDLLDDNHCNKAKILKSFDRCLTKSKGSVSLRFEAIHRTSKTVLVEVFGSIITYEGQTSLAGNVYKIDAKKSKPDTYRSQLNTLTKLSKRELEVLELICTGKSTLETSKILFLGQRTIETYRANLLEKTGSKNIAELMVYAIRNKLIIIE